MARTTHNWVTQGTVGIVPEAVLPTDPVPLSQASGGDSNTFWLMTGGRNSGSGKPKWLWTGDGPYLTNIPVFIPFTARLKQVGWYYYNNPLKLFRNTSTTVIATIQPNTTVDFNFLFRKNKDCFFQVQNNIGGDYSWNLFTKWELEVMTAPEDVQPAPAPVPGGAPVDLIPNITVLNPENQDVPEIVERPGNRWISWIRRKWR